MNDKFNQLYNYLKSNGMTDLDAQSFYDTYRTDSSKLNKLYGYLKSNGMTDLDPNSFRDSYFGANQSKQNWRISKEQGAGSLDYRKSDFRTYDIVEETQKGMTKEERKKTGFDYTPEQIAAGKKAVAMEEAPVIEYSDLKLRRGKDGVFYKVEGNNWYEVAFPIDMSKNIINESVVSLEGSDLYKINDPKKVESLNIEFGEKVKLPNAGFDTDQKLIKTGIDTKIPSSLNKQIKPEDDPYDVFGGWDENTRGLRFKKNDTYNIWEQYKPGVDSRWSVVTETMAKELNKRYGGNYGHIPKDTKNLTDQEILNKNYGQSSVGIGVLKPEYYYGQDADKLEIERKKLIKMGLNPLLVDLYKPTQTQAEKRISGYKTFEENVQGFILHNNIANLEEEEAVKMLTNQFGRYGFEFIESGVNDEMIVRTKDGSREILINLDTEDPSQNLRLQDFLIVNQDPSAYESGNQKYAELINRDRRLIYSNNGSNSPSLYKDLQELFNDEDYKIWSQNLPYGELEQEVNQRIGEYRSLMNKPGVNSSQVFKDMKTFEKSPMYQQYQKQKKEAFELERMKIQSLYDEVKLDPGPNSRARQKVRMFLSDKYLDKTRTEYNAMLNDINKSAKFLKTRYDEYNAELQKLNTSNLTPEQIRVKKEQLDKMALQLDVDRSNLVRRQKAVTTEAKQLEYLTGKYVVDVAKEGGFIGGLMNSFSDGISKMIKTGDVVGRLQAETKGSQIADNMTEEEKRYYKTKGYSLEEIKIAEANKAWKESKEDLSNRMKSAIGDLATTKQYQQSEDRGIVSKALFGLAESLPAMATSVINPYVGFGALSAQAYSSLEDEMLNDPDFETTSLTEMNLIALPYAMGMGALEKIGLSSAMSKNPLAKSLIMKSIQGAVKKTAGKGSAELLQNVLDKEIKSNMAKFGIRIVGGALTEAETGATQSLVLDIGYKSLINEIKKDDRLASELTGGEFFDTPDTFTDGLKMVIEDGIAEGIGGMVMSGFGSMSQKVINGNISLYDNEDVDFLKTVSTDNELRKMIVIKLKSDMLTGKITKSEAEKQLNALDKVGAIFNAMPDNLSVEDQVKSVNLMSEKQRLEKEIDGKDQSLVAAQKERITEIDNELQKISKDAFQKQATGEVPVQPEARVGEEVEGRKPETKLEEVTKKGQEGVVQIQAPRKKGWQNSVVKKEESTTPSGDKVTTYKAYAVNENGKETNMRTGILTTIGEIAPLVKGTDGEGIFYDQDGNLKEDPNAELYITKTIEGTNQDGSYQQRVTVVGKGDLKFNGRLQSDFTTNKNVVVGESSYKSNLAEETPQAEVKPISESKENVIQTSAPRKKGYQNSIVKKEESTTPSGDKVTTYNTYAVDKDGKETKMTGSGIKTTVGKIAPLVKGTDGEGIFYDEDGNLKQDPNAELLITKTIEGTNQDGSYQQRVTVVGIGDLEFNGRIKADFTTNKNVVESGVSYKSNLTTKQQQEVTIDKPVIATNTKAELDRVKSVDMETEDGATFNIDGTKYEGGGLVVPIVSENTTVEEITPEMISDFVEKHLSKIGDQNTVKVGIYKFPNSNKVSIDLNIVAPESSRQQAIEFAKAADQESLFDLSTFENVKTGGTGVNPTQFTDEQFKEIAKALNEGRTPSFAAPTQQNLVTLDNVEEVADKRTATATKLVLNALPGVKIYIHNTNEEYSAAIGEEAEAGDRGAYDTQEGAIHINLAAGGNAQTVFHEAIHHALLKKGMDSGAILDLANGLNRIITDKKLKKRLSDFISQYETSDQAEEYLSELGAIMAEAEIELTTTKFNQFKALIARIFQKLGLPKSMVPFLNAMNSENAVDFINSLTKSLRTGEKVEVSAEKVNTEELSIKKRKTGAFELSYFEDASDFKKLVEEGLVENNYDINKISGEVVAVHQPDNMFVGDLNYKGKNIFKGNGGVFYTSITGNVWASGSETSAKSLTNLINKSLNESTDGVGRLVLVRGTDSKMISSTEGVKAGMSIIELLVDEGLINRSEFRSSLIRAGKKFNIDFSGKDSSAAIHKDIKEKFMDVKNSTFQKRGDFFDEVINDLSKTSESVNNNISDIREFLGSKRKISFSKDGVRDSIGDILTERLLLDLPTSHVYAIIEVTEPVTYEERKGHDSYPWVLKSKSKPKLKLLSNRNHAVKDGVFEMIDGSEVTQGKLGLAQRGMGTAKVSSKGKQFKKQRTDKASEKLQQLFKRDDVPLTLQEAKEIVNEVIDWTTWYDGLSTYVDNIFGEYSEDILSMLPLASMAANSSATVGLAINNAEKIYRGEKPSGVAEYYGYVTDFLEGKGIKSDKMSEFFKALTGNKEAIAVDMHVYSIIMGKNPNKKQVNPSNKQEFDKAKEFVRTLASELGLAPREIQAALWAANILRTGGRPDSYEQYFKKQLDEKGLEQRIETWRNEGYKPFSEIRKEKEGKQIKKQKVLTSDIGINRSEIPLDKSSENISIGKMTSSNGNILELSAKEINLSYPGKKKFVRRIEAVDKDGKKAIISFWRDKSDVLEKDNMIILHVEGVNGYGTDLINTLISESKEDGVKKIIADDVLSLNAAKYWEDKLGFSKDPDDKSIRFLDLDSSKKFKKHKGEKITAPVAGNKLFNEPLKDAENIARSYMQSIGMEYVPVEKITKLDEDLSKRISDAYDQMENNPNDPKVKAAYEAMAKETLDQYDAIVKEGYNVEINNNEPYSNSEAMIKDLKDNKRMKIFSTESGFGDEPITEEQRSENLLLKDSGRKDVNGETLLINDVFRFVHDFFGHAKLGNSFGPVGEENAWRVHSEMYSPEARKAMTSETRGQNSWVNFSGVNDAAFKKRDKARELRKEGKIEEADRLVGEVYEEMKFADQKVGILPDFAIEEGARFKKQKPTSKQEAIQKAKDKYELSVEKRGNSHEQGVASALGDLQKSDWFANADDTAREDAVREIKAFFGEKIKKAPSVAKILGKPKPETQTKTVDALRKEFFTAWNKASREAKADLNSKRKAIGAIIKSMVRSGKITTKQAAVIADRANSINLDNPVIVQRFLDYVGKVFADANYKEKLSNAFSARRAIRRLTKSNNQAEVIGMAKAFLNIDPSMVEDIDTYNEIADSIKNAMAPSVVRGEQVKFKQPANIADVNEYTMDEISRQEEIKKDQLLAEYDYLKDAGLISKDMTLNEIRKIIEDMKSTDTDINDDVKDFVERRLDMMLGIVESIIRTGINPITGETMEISDKNKDILKAIMKMDLKELDTRSLIYLSESVDNFLNNGITSGLEANVHSYVGAMKVKALVNAGVKSVGIKTKASKIASTEILSIPLLFEKLFRGTTIGTRIMSDMGLLDMVNGKNKAELIYNKILESYTKQDFYGKDFMTQQNIIERGMLAYLMRNVNGDNAQVKAELNRRIDAISESIEQLKEGNSDEQKLAEMYENAFSKLKVNSRDIDIIRANSSKSNREAVDWWVDQWKQHYTDLYDVSLSVYNTMLSSDINYTPDKMKLMASKAQDDDITSSDSGFVSSLGYTDTKKAGVLMENVRKKPKNRYVDLNFDMNNANSLRNALVDINTAAAIRQVKGFMDSNNFDKLAGDEASLIKSRINSYVKRMKGKRVIPRSSADDIMKYFNTIAKAGTIGALGGIGSAIKQFSPIINTLVNAGRFISLTPNSNAWIDRLGMPISNRGIKSESNIDTIDRRINVLADSAVGKVYDGVGKIGDMWLKALIQSPDAYVARSSFITYYLKSLRDQGLSTKIDWNTHEVNKKAAEYAQMQVDRQQNVSDPLLTGELFATEDATKKMITKLFMPFTSFVWNQRARMINDMQILGSKVSSKEDKIIAIKSLTALTSEIIIFNALGWGIRQLIDAATNYFYGEDDDDEEEVFFYVFGMKFTKDDIKEFKTPVKNLLVDLFSPLPGLTDEFLVDRLNDLFEMYPLVGDDEIAELIKAENDIRIANGDKPMNEKEEAKFIKDEKEKRTFQLYDEMESTGWERYIPGAPGVALKTYSELKDAIDLAMTGKYEDEYQGRKSTKYISDEDREKVAYGLFFQIPQALGLLPREAGQIPNKGIRNIKKRSYTENQITKMQEVEKLTNRPIGKIEKVLIDKNSDPKKIAMEMKMIDKLGGFDEKQEAEYAKLRRSISKPNIKFAQMIKGGMTAEDIIRRIAENKGIVKGRTGTTRQGTVRKGTVREGKIREGQ